MPFKEAKGIYLGEGFFFGIMDMPMLARTDSAGLTQGKIHVRFILLPLSLLTFIGLIYIG